MKPQQKTILLGSLPFQDLKEALKFSDGFTEFTLPELTFYSQELMLEKVNSNHLSLYLEKNYSIKAKRIFIHLAGPMCLKKYMGLDSDILFKKISSYLKAFNEKELVFIFDEPVMESSIDLNLFFQKLPELGNFKYGLHSCCEIDFTLMEKLRLDYLSFDFKLNAHQVSSLRSICKTMIFGVLDAQGEFYDGFEPLLDPDKDFVSPSCGLAGMSEKQCLEIKSRLLSL